MARLVSKEAHDFIAAHTAGRSSQALTALVNERFGLNLTEQQIRSYRKNHHLPSGIGFGIPAGLPTALFPQPVMDYINANYLGVGPLEMSQRLNERFGTSYTQQQIKSYYGNRGLNSGVTGHFQKGCIPVNAGRKGYCAPGCEKDWFPKGHTPHNKLPIGSLVVKSDGYLWRKTGEGKREWRQEHRLVWEAAHGPVPSGHLLIFLDGDRMNTKLENLALVTRAENAQMTTRHLRSTVPEHTETGILIAKIHNAARQSKKKRKEHA